MRAALLVATVAAARVAAAECKDVPPGNDRGWPLLASVAPMTEVHCMPRGEVVAVVAAYRGKLREPSGENVWAIEKQTAGVSTVTLPGDAPRVVEGIAGEAHLVRLQAEQGERNGRVVVKLATVVDGTPEFPAKLAPLLHATLAGFEQAGSKQSKRWRGLARAANAAAIKAASFDVSVYWPKQRGEDIEAAYRAEWIADAKVVRITFYGRLSTTFTRKVKAPPMQLCNDAELAGPCPPVPNINPYLLETTAFASEYAIVFDIDGSGQVKATRELPVSSPPPKTSTRSPS